MRSSTRCISMALPMSAGCAGAELAGAGGGGGGGDGLGGNSVANPVIESMETIARERATSCQRASTSFCTISSSRTSASAS